MTVSVANGFKPAIDCASGVDGDCQFRDGRSLNCFLRTLQTDLGASSSAVNAASRLEITCSDIFFFESLLKTEHFGNLPSLEELDIQFCKIRHLPPRSFAGLSNLKKLSIQSHNTQWASIIMETLHITISAPFPPRTLCSTPQLTSLDLSYNNILLLEQEDHSRLNLGGYCEDGVSVNITDLNLSYNLISSLSNVVLPRSIRNLNLEGNRVSDIQIKSLTNLENLNLGGNDINRLNKDSFALHGQNSLLTDLSLHNNSLIGLPSQIFESLESLVVLNLSRNVISDSYLSQEAFAGLSKLLTLDLSHNRLRRLQPALFESLVSLEVLLMDSNELYIMESSFNLFKNLRIFGLSSNYFQTFVSHFFNPELKSLSLEGNVLNELPDDLFSNGCALESLNLGKNSFGSVPKFIASSCGSSLKTLDLGENSIESIREHDLTNLTELKGLRLAKNYISELNLKNFDLLNLEVLNLASNSLKKLEPGCLGNMTSLKALRLDKNKLTDLNGVVSGYPNLLWLNVSHNKIQWFDYGFIPRQLERLDLRHNDISELGNYYETKDKFALQFIDVSYNKLTSLNAETFPFKHFKHIAINNNMITEVAQSTFAHLTKISKVELRNNFLRNMRMVSLSISSGSQEIPQMTLNGNPFVCDCEMDWMRDINEIALLGQQHFQIRDLNDLTCELTHKNNGEIEQLKKIIAVPREDFLCSYRTHCFSLCMCCDFFACDCRMQCPEGCDCYHDQTWNRNVISCSASNHTEIPLLIPMDSTEVRLDGNVISNVSSQSFHGRHRVKSLFLNNSDVFILGNQTLTGLSSLNSLHLEDNQISHLYGNEFLNLKKLRELFLHNNALEFINELTFAPLESLTTLTLGGNLLTSFPVWRLLEFNPSTSVLDLSGNPWSCECQFLVPFHRYVAALNSGRRKIGYQDQMKCGSDSRDVSLRLQECSSSSSMSPRFQNHATDWTPILVPIFVAAAVTLLGFLAVFVFKKHIKNWLYDKSNEIYESSRNSSASSSTTPTPQNNLFDVYISHSTENKDFVLQTLAPTLEHGGNNYRLCIHQRDCPSNNSASLQDTVTVAAESSSRILVVLTRSYLKNDWPKVNVPLKNVLKSRPGCSNRLLFLLLEDLLDEERAYTELSHYLKICPSVRWGSPGFLNKLRYFLPEPALMTFQRNVTLRNVQPVVKAPEGSHPSMVNTIYPPASEHTYQSIPENIHHHHHPVYHTLEEFRRPGVSPPSLSPVHTHSKSNSSGQFLLPTEDSDEYVV
nr:toll-like receptor 6 [Lepeophtheirus salmonis]